jgi:uncharacterized protein (TIGR02145 family)
MKKIFIIILFSYSIIACEKFKNNNTSTSSNDKSDSPNCGNNPFINFSSIGKPIGKFTECVTDIDGNTYKTITIGSQQWMAENLKVSRFNDGTIIPCIKEKKQWSFLKYAALCNFNFSASNNEIYGKYYNGFVINMSTNNKNVCPTGWHIPSNKEWIILYEYLGGKNVAGGKMKEIDTNHWDKPNLNATNISLFSGVPAGSVNIIGDFIFQLNSMWWSSTYVNLNVDTSHYDCNNYFYLGNDTEEIYLDHRNWSDGMSIRCVKD